MGLFSSKDDVKDQNQDQPIQPLADQNQTSLPPTPTTGGLPVNQPGQDFNPSNTSNQSAGSDMGSVSGSSNDFNTNQPVSSTPDQTNPPANDLSSGADVNLNQNSQSNFPASPSSESNLATPAELQNNSENQANTPSTLPEDSQPSSQPSPSQNESTDDFATTGNNLTPDSSIPSDTNPNISPDSSQPQDLSSFPNDSSQNQTNLPNSGMSDIGSQAASESSQKPLPPLPTSSPSSLNIDEDENK